MAFLRAEICSYVYRAYSKIALAWVNIVKSWEGLSCRVSIILKLNAPSVP